MFAYFVSDDLLRGVPREKPDADRAHRHAAACARSTTPTAGPRSATPAPTSTSRMIDVGGAAALARRAGHRRAERHQRDRLHAGSRPSTTPRSAMQALEAVNTWMSDRAADAGGRLMAAVNLRYEDLDWTIARAHPHARAREPHVPAAVGADGRHPAEPPRLRPAVVGGHRPRDDPDRPRRAQPGDLPPGLGQHRRPRADPGDLGAAAAPAGARAPERHGARRRLRAAPASSRSCSPSTASTGSRRPRSASTCSRRRASARCCSPATTSCR